MARLGALVALAAFTATLAAACGGNGSVIRTSAPVQALAIDGKRVAWSDCLAVHVSGERNVTIRLPGTLGRLHACGSEGRLLFAGDNVGWYFAANGVWTRSASSYAIGVSSLRSRTSRVLTADPAYDYKIDAGVQGSIAADGRRLLWAWPHVATSGPEDAVNYCGDYTRQRPCKATVGSAQTNSLTGSRHTVVGGIPPAGPLAASDGWIAYGPVRVGTFQQAAELAPHTVVVRSLRGGSVITRIRTKPRVMALALSHRLLAVQHLGGSVGGTVDLYSMPSGRKLRSVRVGNDDVQRMTGSIAAAGDDLILWTSRDLRVVNAVTGATTVLAAPGGAALTAVATDGSRIAWAEGRVIRIRSL
jgi:hypothetical protein